MVAMDMVQKARIRWDVEGDENTNFFHGVIKQRRRHQMVQGLMTDGVWVSNPNEVKTAFLNFYKEKFQAQDSSVSFSPMTSTLVLDDSDRFFLEDKVNTDEIREAVWACGINKAPGPDGFSFHLLKNYWELISYDVTEFVTNFFDSCSIPSGANSAFITLISKVCLHSARTSILVNGSPSSEFSIKRGLRQRDPLSPFLFILVMEGLHLALKDAVQSYLIHGTKVGLKINFHKSNVYGIGVSTEEVSDMARVTAVHGPDAGFDQNGCQSQGGRNTEALNLLLAKIGNVEVGSGEDSWQWGLHSDGSFSVGVTRKHIDDIILPSMITSTGWNKSLPRKEIPSILRPVCNVSVESTDHIFFSCDTAANVWHKIRNWSDVSLPHLCSNSDWIEWLKIWNASNARRDRMYVIIAATLWWLWRYRNNVTFCSQSMRADESR
ncbi:hypothetical protein Tco_0116293 [Tanacetum coccineum]